MASEMLEKFGSSHDYRKMKREERIDPMFHLSKIEEGQLKMLLEEMQIICGTESDLEAILKTCHPSELILGLRLAGIPFVVGIEDEPSVTMSDSSGSKQKAPDTWLHVYVWKGEAEGKVVLHIYSPRKLGRPGENQFYLCALSEDLESEGSLTMILMTKFEDEDPSVSYNTMLRRIKNREIRNSVLEKLRRPVRKVKVEPKSPSSSVKSPRSRKGSIRENVGMGADEVDVFARTFATSTLWVTEYCSMPAKEWPLDLKFNRIENLEITQEQGMIRCEFDIDWNFPDIGLIKGGHNSILMSPEDFGKLPHEAVSACLSQGKTDVRLSNIASVNDGWDFKTPDFIESQLSRPFNKILVTEVKTADTFNMAAVGEKFKEAVSSYKPAIQRRAHLANLRTPTRCHQFGVAVSQCGVVSNLPLKQEEAELLSKVYHVALTLKRELEVNGLILSTDDDLEERRKKILAEITSLELPEDSEDKLIITKKLLRHFEEDYSEDFVAEIFTKVMNEAKEKYEKAKENKSISLMQEYIDNLRELKKKNEAREDLKAPVQLPMAVVFKNPKPWHIRVKGESPLSRLWESAFCSKEDLPERFKEVMGGISERVEKNEPSTNKSKNKNNKVETKLNEEDKVELAKSGVNAKKRKNIPVVKESKEKSKKPFTFETYTGDITDFINNKSIMKISNGTVNPHVENCKELLDKAAEIAQCETIPRTVVETLFNTHLGLGLTLIEEIVSEVNYSRKNNCKEGEFILKHLKNFDVWVLIKPTKADEHIFFSVLIPKNGSNYIVGLPFKEPEVQDNCWLYPFVSFKYPAIEQYIGITSTFALIFTRQCMLYSKDILEELKEPSMDVLNHALAELLFLLENKNQTSADIQMYRYAYMEMIRAQNNMDPFKIVEKFDARPRSRLLIWAHKGFRNAFEQMMAKKPKVGCQNKDPEGTQDVCENLISWVTRRPVPSFEAAIELSYICNLRNKHGVDFNNASMKIVTKLVSEEMKLYEKTDEDYCGWKERLEIENHEFSHSFVSFCAAQTRKVMDRRLPGVNKSASLYDRISKKLAEVTWLDLATMKSSAYGLLANKEFELNKGKKKEKTSQKCLEAAKKLAEETGTNFPFTKLKMLIGKVEEQGGMMANLFAKEQIGGPREIFRLNMESRALQKFVECVAACIDEILPNAMLTKGKYKLSRSFEHHRRISNRGLNDRSITLINSNDCKVWCQNFVMNAFAATFNKLLPEILKPAFFIILNLVTKKSIELPYEMLSQFHENPLIDSFNPTIQRLKEEFVGMKKCLVLKKPGSRMMRNRSNMMQGQCHFISDVHHASFQIGMETLLKNHLHVLNIKLKFTGKDALKLLITPKASSDDSSHLNTLEAPSKAFLLKNFKGMFMLLTMYSYAFGLMSKYANMMTNFIKSTEAVATLIEEFNSIWLMRNTILAAPIKHIYTSICLPTTSQMIMRYHEWSNLITELFESGGSTFLCSVAQICQAYNSYQMLGSLTSSLWNSMKAEILKKPHPIFCFFPLQPTCCAGMFGLEFSTYLLCKSDPNALKVEWWLQSTDGEKINDEIGKMASFRISQGEEKKLEEFKRKMEVDEDELEDYVLNKPTVMLMEPVSLSDSVNMMKIKSLSLSIADSLIRKKPADAHLTSCFMISEPCITCVKKKFENGTVSTEKGKSNFWNILTKLEMQDPPDDAIDRLFDKRWFYDVLMESFVDNVREVFRRLKHKKRQVNVFIPSTDVSSVCTLLDAALAIWFNKQRHSITVISDSWKHYTMLYPWIKESFKETLENPECPFRSAIGLCNFIKSKTSKSLNLHSYCSGQHKASTMDTIRSIIENSYWPGIGLNISQSEVRTRMLDDKRIDLLKMEILLIMAGPPAVMRPIDEVARALKAFDSSNYLVPENFLRLNEEEEKLVLLSHASKGGDPGEIIQSLTKSKYARIGTWVVRAPKYGGEYVGRSVWVGFVNRIPVRLIVDGLQITLIEFESADVSVVLQSGPSVKNLIKSFGLNCGINQQKIKADYFFSIGAFGVVSTRFSTDSVPVKLVDVIPRSKASRVRIRIDIQNRCIKLMQNGIDETVMIPMLSAPINLRKVPAASLSGTSVSYRRERHTAWLLDAWFKNQQISADEFLTKFPDFYENSSNELLAWFKEKAKKQYHVVGIHGKHRCANENFTMEELSLAMEPNEDDVEEFLDFLQMENFAADIGAEIEEKLIWAEEMEEYDERTDESGMIDFEEMTEQEVEIIKQMAEMLEEPTFTVDKGNINYKCLNIDEHNQTFSSMFGSLMGECGKMLTTALKDGYSKSFPPALIALSKLMGMPEIQVPLDFFIDEVPVEPEPLEDIFLSD